MSAPYLYLFFVLGLLGRREIEALAAAFERLRWLPLLVVLVFLPVAILVVSFGAQSNGAVMLGMRVVGLFFGVALSVLLARVAVLTYLGARTLQIYVAHMPIIAAVVIVLSLAGVSIQHANGVRSWSRRGGGDGGDALSRIQEHGGEEYRSLPL